MFLVVWAGSATAGFLGAITGLGGGVVVVPLLALALHVDLRYAIGASLLSVIATSSGAAAAYVREGISNIRIGMFLEIATTVGALAGAAVAAHVATGFVATTFGLVLLGAAAVSLRRAEDGAPQGTPPAGLARTLRLHGRFVQDGVPVDYSAQRAAPGFALMFVAGMLSGLLGIGSGALKVIAMDNVMRLPFKVSTTTSNFMIGVTAAASAGVYLSRGYIAPGLAAPVVLGILPGALLGARVLPRVHSRVLRLVFTGVIVALAVEMFFKGVTGSL